MNIDRVPRMLLCCAALVVRGAGQPGAVAADCFDQGRGVDFLAPAQRAVVNRGEPLVITVDRADRRWPQVCVYQFISAAPEPSLAVLVDYPLRPTYLPDVQASTVVPATADSVVKRVAYVVHVF